MVIKKTIIKCSLMGVLLIFMMLNVNAAPLYEVGRTLTTGAVGAWCTGYSIYANKNVTFDYAHFHTGSTNFDVIRFYDFPSGIPGVNTSIKNQSTTCAASNCYNESIADVNLTAGHYYLIQAHSTGSSSTGYYGNTGPTLPANNTNIAFIAGTDDSTCKYVPGTTYGRIFDGFTTNEIIYAPPTNYSASFIFPTPANNSHNNTQINITINCTMSGHNFTLYFSNSTDPTTKVLNYVNTSSWLTNVSADGTYYYKANCGNTGVDLNTSVYKWVYDITNPVLAVYEGCSEFNSLNMTIRSPFDNNVSFCFNFTDNAGLFAYELEVYDVSSVKLFNFSNSSLAGVTSFNLKNWTNYSFIPGRYVVNISLADTHTAAAIEDYVVDKTTDGLLFRTAEGSLIKLSGLSSIDSTATKSVDKYEFSFSYEKDVALPEKVFYVESLGSEQVIYLPSSKYKAHFVIFDPVTFNGNWVDFEGVEGEPVVRQLSSHKYSITFSDLKEEEVLFKSIGGLNLIHELYSFVVGNYSFNNDPVLAGSNHSQEVFFNTAGVFNLTNISLLYDGSLYSPLCINLSNGLNCSSFVTPLSNGTVLFTWNFSVLGSGLMYNVTGNESSLYWNISLCSATGTNLTTINISFFNENLPLFPDNASLELELFMWAYVTSNNKTINLNFSDNLHNYSLCIVNGVNLSTNVYFKFFHAAGFTNRYYWFNRTLSSVPINLSLYVYNYTTGVSNLKITARDSNTFRFYPNILGKLQRRYLSEGVYRDVQMDLSDDYGLLFYNVLEESVDYRLLFYDTANNLLKTSDNLKFSCDAGICDLTAEINPLGTAITETNIIWSYVYDNVTNLITVTWEDLSGLISSVRVYGEKRTLTGNLMVCNSTQVGVAGSYSCNVSGVTGEVFMRISKTASPESDETGWWIKLKAAGVSLGDQLTDTDSAFWSFLIVVVISLLGIFSMVAAIIMGVMSLVALYALGLATALNMMIITVLLVMGLALAFKIRR